MCTRYKLCVRVCAHCTVHRVLNHWHFNMIWLFFFLPKHTRTLVSVCVFLFHHYRCYVHEQSLDCLFCVCVCGTLHNLLFYFVRNSFLLHSLFFFPMHIAVALMVIPTLCLNLSCQNRASASLTHALSYSVPNDRHVSKRAWVWWQQLDLETVHFCTYITVEF